MKVLPTWMHDIKDDDGNPVYTGAFSKQIYKLGLFDEFTDLLNLDGTVVGYNPTMTMLLGCNTAFVRHTLVCNMCIPTYSTNSYYKWLSNITRNPFYFTVFATNVLGGTCPC